MKKWICLCAACLSLLLGGCDRNEPENDAFPLALGIEAKEDALYRMYLAYPDLSAAEAADNALAKDVFWDGEMENLTDGTGQMAENSNRNVDMNHLKVLVLDRAMLDGGKHAEELIAFFREKRDASWNAYVFLADGEMSDLFSETLQTDTCLGLYLESIVEGWDSIKSGSLVTVGDLVSQYYNRTEQLLIPMLGICESTPVVECFVTVDNLIPGEETSMEEVFAANNSLILYYKE